MIGDDMDDLLRDYFRWAATNSPDDIGYPHVEPVRRLLGGTVGSVGLSDDEAIHIDKAIGYLKRENPQAHRALLRVYKDRKTARWMERRGEGDRRAIAMLITEGREFIRGAIFGVIVSR